MVDTRPACLVWLPHSYTGRGPAESCVRIVEHFPAAGIDTTLFVHRRRTPVKPALRLVEALGTVGRQMPYRFVRARAEQRLERLFTRAIDAAAVGTIAWFWPDVPIHLVLRAKERGLITVREMINSPLAHAKPILDAAYAAAGLLPEHGITDAMVAAETEELALHDLIFAANDEVENALTALGIPRARILSSSFGWVASRFQSDRSPEPRTAEPLRACFVGLINVRKGVPTLLAAWDAAGIDGELVLAGSIEPALVPLVERHCATGKVRHLGHIEDVGALYRSSDLFVFPTHEEGGPQVTYEAAGCGLCVVTTPMGAARLVQDGRTGRIVEPGDVAGLRDVLRQLAANAAERRRLAEAGREAAAQFTYSIVGARRAQMIRDRWVEQTDHAGSH